MMKNIKRTSILSILGLVLLFFNACDDTSEMYNISTPTAPVLSELTTTNLELDAVNTNNPAITLNWKSATYGQQAAVNYAIQFSSDEGFTSPVTSATITGQNALTLSVSEVNAAAGVAGLNPFEWSTLHARVVSSLGTQGSEPANSNTITLSVYPYYNYTFNDYYLVGNAVSSNWNNNDNNPGLFRDASDSNKFYYTGYFGAGEFKVLEVKGLWQPQWGTNDTSTIEVNPGGGSDPGSFPNNNLPMQTAGYYEFSIDFASKTFTFEPYTEAGSAVFTGMSIQGSATEGLTAVNQLGFDQHIWYLNGVHLVPGNVEFVTNTSAIWGSDTSFSGTATENGGSIPVIVEDDYDVWFNDLTGRYILIPLNL
jgi:hypothetical protein